MSVLYSSITYSQIDLINLFFSTVKLVTISLWTEIATLASVINSKINDPFFIFLSDDYWYIKDIFSHLTNSYISQGTALEDFALMSLCQAGILSASTFSWWGSYFAKKSCSENVIA